MRKAHKILFLYVAMVVFFAFIIRTPVAIAKNKKVLSFEQLDQIEEYENLPRYGLVPPNKSNHESGKNLIMLSLKATSYFKGDWVMAHGLLGVTMLNVELHDRLGYRSLFLSYAFMQNTKLYAIQSTHNNALLVENDRVTICPMKSIIAKREAAIFAISCQLENRYIYNDAGNFDKNYSPEPLRASNNYLKKSVIQGLEIYNILKGQGFNDKTLGDAIGIANASLLYDLGVAITANPDIVMLGPPQIFLDTLDATIEKMKDQPGRHSYDFLYELGLEMGTRGLAVHDLILTPKDKRNFQAMLRIVEKDLEVIRKVNKK